MGVMGSLITLWSALSHILRSSLCDIFMNHYEPVCPAGWCRVSMVQGLPPAGVPLGGMECGSTHERSCCVPDAITPQTAHTALYQDMGTRHSQPFFANSPSCVSPSRIGTTIIVIMGE